MSDNLTVTTKVHFGAARHGRKKLVEGEAPDAAIGRVPRVSRLMAIAIRFQGLLDRGEVRDYADLARLGHVTRARVTQIMNMLSLAPDIQEQVLYLPLTIGGRDKIAEWEIRPIAAEADWREQRRTWESLANDHS